MLFWFRHIASWTGTSLNRARGRFVASQKISQTRISINLLQEQIQKTFFQIHRLGVIRVIGSIIGIIFLQAIPLTGLMAIEAVTNANAVVETPTLTDEVFHVAQSDFAASEDVTFSIEVAQKPLLPIFDFGKVERAIDGMTLMTPAGDIELSLAADSIQTNGRSVYEQYTISHEYATAPGKYQLLITTTEDGEQVTTERDFYWGVLVLNTDQDSYRPGDVAIFQMGAVDGQGETVCNADMVLTLTAPDGQLTTLTTDDGTIERSTECGPTTVTHTPDYRATAPLTLTGTYQMALTAEYDGITHTWDGTVDVTEIAPFTIRRVGPSRIWPLAEYHMTLTITPQADYHGSLREQVPSDFTITEINADGIYSALDDAPFIEWQVDWRAGESYHLSYTFDAPDISPALFTLGPVTIGDYIEARQWLIASDVISVAAVDATASAQSENVDGDGRKLVWTSDTTGYLFYTDGSTFVSYSKTTNAGMTWAAAVVLTARATENFSIWYDQWTPGNTGGLIHVAFLENAGDDIYYEYVDTASADAQKGEVIVVTRATAHTALTDSVSITRATDGDLYIAYSSSTAATTSGVRYSTDVGTNWNDTAAEGLDDTSGDAVMLLPQPAGDILMLRWDISAEDIQSKEYEDGANTWDGAWTDVDTNAVDSTTLTETWAATLKPSTWQVFLAYVDNAGTTGSSVSDIRTATYTGNAWAANTDVYTNYDTISGVTIGLDTITNDVYVGYLRGLAAGPTVVQAYYKISRDNMATWELERGNVVNFSGAFRGIMGNFASPYRISVWAFDDTGSDIWFGDLQDIGSHANALQVTNIEGFETQSNLTTAVAITGTLSYSTSVFRSGAAALRTNPSSATGFVTHTFSYAATGKDALTNYDNFSSVFALRVASGTTINQQTIIYSATDGTTVVAELSINADQTISLTTGTDVNGTFALVDDTWYVIAFAYGIDNDVLRVGIFSSDMNTFHESFEQSVVSATTMDRVRIGPQTASTTADLYFDDFMVYANSITRNFPLLRADYHIEPMVLNATGTDTAWTNTYTNLTELPTVVSDASYIESQAAAAAETSNLESASSAGISGSVLAVRLTNMIWESSAATTSIQGIRWREGASLENSTAVDASGTAAAPINYSSILTDEVGTTSLWDTASLDALEVGVLTATSETVFYRNGSSVVQVAFVPASTITISGTCNAFDQTTVCGDTGTVKVAINGVLQAQEQVTVGGTWSITGVPKPPRESTVTVFIDTAVDADEAAAVTRYDGAGDITGVTLFKEHLTFGSVDDQIVRNYNLGQYDYTNDEDIFADVDINAGNTLNADAAGQSSQEELYVLSGDTYEPHGTTTTFAVELVGILTLGTQTMNVAGTWTNGGTFNEGTSTVVLNGATSVNFNSSCSNTDTCTNENFYNLTINKTDAGDANDNVTLTTNGLRITNTLTITDGELVQGALNVRVEGATAVSIASGGKWNNVSTGDVKLGGTFTSAGTAIFNSNAGSQCTDAANDIVITSTVADTTRLWTNTGTLTLYNVEADDMTDSSITAYTSDLTDAQTTWLAGDCGITVSGTAYTSHTEGATLNSSAGTIKLVNAATGATFSDSDGTDGAGLWSVPNVTTPANGNDLIIYINDTTADGTLVLQYGASCTGTPNCTGLKLYQNAVIIRNEDTGSVTNQDLSGCDNDSGTNCIDAEIGYTSNLSGTYNLTTSSGRELHIWTGDTLDPGGTITTDATGGDIHVDDSASLDFDTPTNTVGANLVIDTSATVNVLAATTVTGAAAGGVTVAGTLNQTSGAPTFTIGNGTDEDLTTNTGASVTLSSGTTVIKDDLVMNAGTVAVSNTMDHNDNTTGNIIDLNGGGLTISGGTYTLGGGLEQDGGTATVSTTFTLGGDIDVNTGTLDIDASSNVDFAGVFCSQVGAIINLDGGTTDGTTASTSHFRFNGGTINLNGGTHRTSSGAIVEWARNTASDCNSDGTTGNTTFNMSGGIMRSRAFFVYGNYTMTTTTVSGGTLELGYGETQANTQLVNLNSSSFQFYNVTVVESGVLGGTQTNTFPIKNLFTINSLQDFNLNGEDMTVDGGWVNNGTMTQPSAGTVVLRGGQFTGTGDSKFFNLTIDLAAPGTVTVDTDAGADDPTVFGALNVAANDALAIEVNRTVTVDDGGSLTLTGTINGAGRLTYQPTAAFPTGGVIDSILRFDSTLNDQTMSQRTYGGNVESYSTGGAARALTMGTAGGQTINITGSLTVANDFSGMSVTAATHDPTVNITGDLGACINLGDGIQGFTADAGIWTVTGNVNMANCDGSAFSGTHTLTMNGTSKTLTTSFVSWQNVTLSGTIILANSTHAIKGNLDLTGSTITQGTSTVNMTGTAHAITGASQTLNNLTINPASPGTITLQTTGLTVGGTLNVSASDALTINSGLTLLHTGATLTLTGTINGPGRLTYRSATAFPTTGVLAASLILRMDATSTDQSMGARTDYQLVEIDNSGTTAGRTVTVGTAGSQTITINSTLDLMNTGADPSTTIFQVNTWDPAFTVTGSVTIAANATFEASSATTTNFGDDFSNSGTFNANAGTIALTTATAATIAGSTTFQNLSVSAIGAAKTITFTAGTTQTVSGTWTIAGALGQVVTLQSSAASAWTINPTAASVDYATVSWSNSGLSICATHSTDGLNNNANWQFSAGATCGIDVAGTSNSSGGTVRVAVNNTQQAQTTTLAATWTITGVTVSINDIVTVYVEGVDTAETTGVAQYDGTGNIGGMVLNTNVLSIGSDDNQTLDLTDLDLYSCADNENVMHSVAAGVLDVEGTDAGCGANPANSYTDETITATASDTLSIGNAQTMNSHNVTVNASGVLTSGTTGVFSVSGSWDNNGTFTASTSTVTFNSGSTETVEAGSSSFNVVEFANAAGTWTVQTNNMTTAGNLTLTSGTFTLETGRTLEVQGNYSQVIAAANTTWTGSTLYLNGSGGMYDINTKTHGGDTYATLRVGGSEDIAMWDSSATTFTIDAGGCLFSEDHATTAGRLNIYGTCNSRANEYWSYASDFDGAAVTRQADVRFAPSATLAVDNGDTLAVLGQNAGANRSLVTRESTGNYGLTISGTINAQYYDFDYLNASGLNITSTATVTELSDGSFDNNAAGASSSYITVNGITSAKNFFRNVFDDSGDGTDASVVYNVNADGSGISWTFFNWDGNKAGEDFDLEANSAYVGWKSELTLSINDFVMSLGTIGTLSVGSDTHNITVTTNARNGYTCMAVDDGNLRSGGNDINDVGDGTVTAGTEEYGLSCTGTDCDLTGDNALSGTPLQVASNTGRVTASATSVTYKAAASSATVGTTYTHIVTFTCTGDF